jgi:hypothetical protein
MKRTARMAYLAGSMPASGRILRDRLRSGFIFWCTLLALVLLGLGIMNLVIRTGSATAATACFVVSLLLGTLLVTRYLIPYVAHGRADARAAREEALREREAAMQSAQAWIREHEQALPPDAPPRPARHHKAEHRK